MYVCTLALETHLCEPPKTVKKGKYIRKHALHNINVYNNNNKNNNNNNN